VQCRRLRSCSAPRVGRRSASAGAKRHRGLVATALTPSLRSRSSKDRRESCGSSARFTKRGRLRGAEQDRNLRYCTHALRNDGQAIEETAEPSPALRATSPASGRGKEPSPALRATSPASGRGGEGQWSSKPSSLSLRVSVLRPQPSSFAASCRPPRVAFSASRSSVRSNSGRASSSSGAPPLASRA
jgi:hypothetical protein